MVKIKYPPFAGDRGVGFWMRWSNVWASRQALFRADRSNEWRYSFGKPNPPDRSVRLESLLPDGRWVKEGVRLVLLADTGEGDASQYGLIPLLRALKPDFMIINGDVANPAGRINTEDPGNDDFQCGFFQPYKNFPCAIWATPGNHEYYSPDHGLSFYQVFCTNIFDRRWAEAGLPHKVFQPGTYWEVSDLEGPSKLIIIGLDTGVKGNLDGSKPNSGYLSGKPILPDNSQLIWLDERLSRADRCGGRAVLLYHIPPLNKQEQDVKQMRHLQQVIAGHRSVKLVLCGHEHNHQQYEPAVYRRYLKEQEEGDLCQGDEYPHYIICGGGGSALHSTDFDSGRYQGFRYPSADQWREYLSWGTKVVGSAKINTSLASLMVWLFDRASRADADAAKFRSLILLDIEDGGHKATVRPVFMDDVDKLFDPNSNDVIDVLDEHPKVDMQRVESCIQSSLSFEI